MPSGVVSVGVLADFAELIEQSETAGVSIEAFGGKVVTSARQASRAMADFMKTNGASAEAAKAAAAETSAAWNATAGSVSRSTKAMGDAALATSRLFKEAGDQQSASYAQAIAAGRAAEAQSKAAADAAAVAAAKTAAAAEESAAKVTAAGKSLATFGKWAAGGLAITAVVSVKGAAEFEAQMEKIHTQAGATQQQVAELSKGVLNMAGSVGTGPQDLAEGMYHVVSAFDKAGKASLGTAAELNVLKIASEGAKVGGADLVDVTNALDAAVVSGISGVHNYSQAMGALNGIVGAGDMTMQNLADALGTGLLGPMKTYGLSLKDIGGALATFGDNNIRGQEAATKLTSAVRIMAAPSAAASKALGAVGLSTLELANDMRSGGLVGALSDLKKHLVDSGATASQQALVITRAFGGRQSTGVQLLIEQLDRLKAKTNQVGDSAGNFNADWAATQKTFAFQMDQLKASVEALSDKFGAVLIPKLEDVAKATGNVIDWFEKHQAAAKALADVIVGVLGAAITAFAVTKTAQMISGLQNMGAAMSTLVGQFGLGSKAIVADADEAAIGTDAALGATGIGGAVVALGVAASELALHWNSVMSDLQSAAQQIVNPIVTAFDTIIGKAHDAISVLAAIGGKTMSKDGLSPGTKIPASLIAPGAHGTYTVGESNINPSGKVVSGHNIVSNPFATSSTNEKVQLARYEAEEKKALAALKHPKGLSQKALGALGVGGGGGSTPTSDSTTAAAATSTIPAAVATMLATAQSLIGTKYTWGGGHGGWDPVAELKQIGVDCSGFVSQVLHAGGVQLPGPQTTAGLAQDLKPGKGSDVTVYDRPSGSEAHTIIDILGKYFESGGNSAYNPNPNHVSQLTAQQAAGELSGGGFEAFHPAYSTKLATDKTLGKLGVSSTTGQNVTESLEQLVAKIKQAIAAPANSLIESYGNATRTGSVSTLETALGSTGQRGTSFGSTIRGEAGGSQQQKNFQAEYAALTKTGQDKLADKMAAAHAAAMQALSTKIIAIQTAEAAKALAAITKPATELVTRLQNGTQTGSISGLERTLGVRTGRNQSPSFGAVMKGESGSGAERTFESRIEALVRAGQTTLATKLVTAHTQAMQALSSEMIAKQTQADAEQLGLLATKLQDQTTAIQNEAAAELTVRQAEEQKVNDMAAAVVQNMQNVQQTVDDMAAGVVSAIRDTATASSDQSQGVVDAINDSTQITVDTIGEKGLYGANLITQQLQVQADKVKQYWDKQLALDQATLDADQKSADQAEAAAKVTVDQVTTQQQMLVQAAQAKLDNVTITQDQRIATATAHADAVQQSVDTTTIGPAQIAVDMNANAPKATQDIFAAQLTKATSSGDATIATANKGLADTIGSATNLIQTAQSGFDAVNNTATQTIQGANDTLNNVTNYWNKVIAGDSSTLSSDQGSAAIGEAGAQGAVAISGATASTQFAGSGMQVNIYGADLSQPSAVAEAASWAIRQVAPTG